MQAANPEDHVPNQDMPGKGQTGDVTYLGTGEWPQEDHYAQ